MISKNSSWPSRVEENTKPAIAPMNTSSNGYVLGFAVGAGVGEHPHLDQPVRLQRQVDLAGDGVGQALLADHHDRVQVVGFAALVLALGGREGNGRHRRIIP